MNKLLCSLLFLVQSLHAIASGQTDCEANAGTYMTGVVVSSPQFGKSRNQIHGVQLSHTVFNVQSDQDGRVYQVAIDNVFAVDFQQNAQAMPHSLASIYEGGQLELCGQLYKDGRLGIHWVHNNCNETATPSTPNGWIKEIADDGSIGSNLESSQSYCYLWAPYAN